MPSRSWGVVHGAYRGGNSGEDGDASRLQVRDPVRGRRARRAGGARRRPGTGRI